MLIAGIGAAIPESCANFSIKGPFDRYCRDAEVPSFLRDALLWSAPQDEGKLDMASKTHLILRSPLSGRLEGRTNACPRLSQAGARPRGGRLRRGRRAPPAPPN